MSWGITAIAATTMVSSYQKSGKQNLANIGASTEGFIGDAEAWAKNEGDNKAIAEANLQNQIRTGYKVGLLNVQKAQAKKSLLAQGISISRARQQALGAATANAAAAGTIGSSVDAVTTDIESKIGEANANLDADYAQTAENFDIQLKDILMSGQDALKSAVNITVRDREMAQTSSGADAVWDGVIAAAGTYAQSRMSLGTGSTGSASSSGSSLGSGITASSSAGLGFKASSGSSASFGTKFASE